MNESSSFWMSVLTDLKACGVEDMLITTTNNVNGFTQIFRSVFPESQTQIFVVNQIIKPCRYVVRKDRKQFTADMKHFCYTPTKLALALVLNDLANR